MRKFKNKILYRWLSQQNDDKDDNPLTDVLVIPGQNVNSPSLGKLEPKANVKNANVRPSLEKLEPVTYVENFTECPSLEKLEPVTYVENLNECPSLEKLEPVTYVENFTECPSLEKLEPVTYVENFTECPSQHKLESVTHVENINECLSQGELEPVTYVENLTESTYQDDLETITCVENFNEGVPHGYTSVAWDETNNESLQPNEMISETYVESINKIHSSTQWPPTTSDSIISESTTVYEIRSDSLEDAVSEMPNTLDLTLGNYDGKLGLMTPEYEYASLRDYGAPSNLTVQSTIKTSLSNYTDTSTAVSEITSMSTDESIDEINIKNITRMVVSTFAFRIFGILLVFVDMFLIVLDLIITDVKIGLGCRAISLAIALFFLCDVLLRVYVEGSHQYFSDFLNTLDAAIIVITLMIDATYFFFNVKFLKNLPRLAVLFRPLRLIILIRVFHLAHQKRQLEMLTRRLVSGNKRRYQKDGFDLDLTYVTERIIAMSFPSSGRQSFYRNPIKEVVRFLDTKHLDHYRVYNLCSEKGYNPKHFHNRVHRIMIDDHNVPSLSEMVEFSKEVTDWLDEDKENVVVIHCKGGKGRTGTMVCACLISSQLFYTAEDSLSFFGRRRTDQTSSTKYQGVETPSQNRYVGYFEKVKRVYHWDLPPRKILKPNKIIIYSIHSVGKGDGSDLNVQVLTKQKLIYSCSSKNCKIFHDIEMDRVIIDLSNCPVVYDDVKMRFLSKKLPNYYDKCAFFFWFHTSFIQNNRLYLQRNQLDNPHKPKSWKIYHSQFAVEVYFDKT